MGAWRHGGECRPAGEGRCAFTTVPPRTHTDRKSTRLNSSHANISYAVFCLKKKKNKEELVGLVHHGACQRRPLVFAGAPMEPLADLQALYYGLDSAFVRVMSGARTGARPFFEC